MRRNEPISPSGYLSASSAWKYRSMSLTRLEGMRMWVVLGILLLFTGGLPRFQESDEAVGGRDKENGADEEPFVAAPHDAEGDVDGIAYQIANPRIDVLAHHEEGGDGLKGEDGAVEHRQVGMQYMGVEEVGGGGDAHHCQQRPQGVAPADGAAVVLGLLLPDEDPADGGQDAVDLEGKAHKMSVGKEVVAQDEARDYAEDPSPTVAAGGKVDGGDLRDGDEDGEDGF